MEAEWEPVQRKKRHFNAKYGQFFEDFRGRATVLQKGPKGSPTGSDSPPRGSESGSPAHEGTPLARSGRAPSRLESSAASVEVTVTSAEGVTRGIRAREGERSETGGQDLLTGDAYGDDVGKVGVSERGVETRRSQEMEATPPERAVVQGGNSWEKLTLKYADYLRPNYMVFTLADAVRLAAGCDVFGLFDRVSI